MVIVDVLALTSLQRDLPGDVLSRVLGVFDTLVLGRHPAGQPGHRHPARARRPQRRPDRGGPRDPGDRADRAAHPAPGRPHLGRRAARLRPRVELLSQLDLLAGADHNTLERLAAAAEEVVLPAGSVVIREGDEPDALWILERGELSVSAPGDGGSPASCRR